MKNYKGWKVVSEKTWTNYYKGDWKVVRYNNKDWSVYLKDIDGIYQYQIHYLTKKSAFAHCS